MSKKVVSIFAVIALSAAPLLAHPPKNNETAFNHEAMTLKVKALHPVSNPATHFVKSISVLLNGQAIAVKAFDRQYDPDFQEWEFKFDPATVSLPQGGKLTVISECSIYGKKKTEVRIDS